MRAAAVLAFPVGVVAGAWLEAAGTVLVILAAGDSNDPGPGAGVTLLAVCVAYAVVSSTIVMTLWARAASGILQARSLSRTRATTLFALATAVLMCTGALTVTFAGPGNGTSLQLLPLTAWGCLAVLAYWATALAAVVLLRQRDSREFFDARRDERTGSNLNPSEKS